ncbi:hypothetical protein GFH48_06585 [Streptomyces fagopyri]|uniref:Uncharacterized protein n=1 Tax=Streptomyces fagopyri TaxID=2662397 RepID=A0A5Q0L7Q9_9ACTN|nr:hypothetical protein [Streptomyces fagopyri]QFZ72971.1 hypothetical protein GFH48_06585 [Streptomyces fagopyri]
MTSLPLPPPPGDGKHLCTGQQSPDSVGEEADSWLCTRRRGQASVRLPLRLVESFLISRDGRKPVEGLVRFQIAESIERRRSWSRRTEPGSQLAGSAGELRLVRHRIAHSRAPRLPLAVLTLNGITDVTPLARLSIANPFLVSVGSERGRAAAADLDVHFLGRLWDLAVAERTRCQLHLEGSFSVLPHWPSQP